MTTRFPTVTCDRHPDQTGSGYAVCVHVARSGATIAHFVSATADDLGEALCSDCHAQPPDVDGLILVCSRCIEGLMP